MRKPDDDGRYPLTQKELDALYNLFAAYHALNLAVTELKERISIGNPSGYGLKKGLVKQVENTLADVLGTIPVKKLVAIRADLQRCQVRIQVKGTAAKDKSVYCIEENDFVDLLNLLAGMHCLLCDKTYGEASKCPIYKVVNKVIHWDLERGTGGVCPLAGTDEIAS